MAERRLIEIDGKRVDITHAPIILEQTCDGCGEYSARAGLRKVQATIYAENNLPVELSVLLHASCMGSLPRLVDDAIVQAPPF